MHYAGQNFTSTACPQWISRRMHDDVGQLSSEQMPDQPQLRHHCRGRGPADHDATHLYCILCVQASQEACHGGQRQAQTTVIAFINSSACQACCLPCSCLLVDCPCIEKFVSYSCISDKRCSVMLYCVLRCVLLCNGFLHNQCTLHCFKYRYSFLLPQPLP